MIEIAKHDNRPNIFDIRIIDYGPGTVKYCKGYFRYPTNKEKESSSRIPIAIFQNVESHGWKVWFYSLQEIKSAIELSRPI